jgi:hypothetical protein
MIEIKNIKKRFFDSLKRGTGEAYILQKENKLIDFSDLIIKGSLTNYSYDNQSEGSRADYLFRLIKCSKQKDKIIKSILKKLQTKKNDYYGLDQICDLAVLFFKAGHIEAKAILFNRFEMNIIEGYEFCGQDQIMEICGIEGILKVAEITGKILSRNSEDYEASWRMDRYQKKHKEIDVYAELKKASVTNEFVKIYFDSIVKHKWNLPRRKKIKRFTYKIIKTKIDARSFLYISVARANELTEEEVEKLANDFLTEEDLKIKLQYLRFFSIRKYPYNYQKIFEIVKAKKHKKTRFIELAMEALKHFKSKEIRSFALEKFRTEKNPCEYICLLRNNYKTGDKNLLVEIANRSNDYNFIHSIVFGFLDIFTLNHTKQCREPLEAIYEKMNCGIHRADIVKILNDNKVLSKKIFRELEFDSDMRTRKFYRQLKKIENRK